MFSLSNLTDFSLYNDSFTKILKVRISWTRRLIFYLAPPLLVAPELPSVSLSFSLACAADLLYYMYSIGKRCPPIIQGALAIDSSHISLPPFHSSVTNLHSFAVSLFFIRLLPEWTGDLMMLECHCFWLLSPSPFTHSYKEKEYQKFEPSSSQRVHLAL